jgi:hypothetical protein
LPTQHDSLLSMTILTMCTAPPEYPMSKMVTRVVQDMR